MIRKLVASDDVILRQQCLPVDLTDPSLVHHVGDLLRDLSDTMRSHNGLGLAAPQVGWAIRAAVVQLPLGAVLHIVNPTVFMVGEKSKPMTEGCLSLPYIRVKIRRPTFVRLQYQRLDGEVITYPGWDLIARAIFHELDHLDGRLITHYAGGGRSDYGQGVSAAEHVAVETQGAPREAE